MKFRMYITTLITFGVFAGFERIGFSAPPAAAQPAPDGMALLWPIMLSFGVIYLLIIRPQQRRDKQQRLQLSSIEKGDEVVTKGGLMGKVTNVAEKVLTVEISDKTRVRIDRDFIFHVVKENGKKAESGKKLQAQNG